MIIYCKGIKDTSRNTVFKKGSLFPSDRMFSGYAGIIITMGDITRSCQDIKE